MRESIRTQAFGDAEPRSTLHIEDLEQILVLGFPDFETARLVVELARAVELVSPAAPSSLTAASLLAVLSHGLFRHRGQLLQEPT